MRNDFPGIANGDGNAEDLSDTVSVISATAAVTIPHAQVCDAINCPFICVDQIVLVEHPFPVLGQLGIPTSQV